MEMELDGMVHWYTLVSCQLVGGKNLAASITSGELTCTVAVVLQSIRFAASWNPLALLALLARPAIHYRGANVQRYRQSFSTQLAQPDLS